MFYYLRYVWLQIPVAPKAKTKKVKLNLTKVSLLQGATVQLKLLNKKAGAVKWYSKNKKKATVNKKGKVTAKKTGSVVVYAKYKKKQYKCKVTVKAPVKVANMKENNAIFTRNVYQKISKIQRLVVSRRSSRQREFMRFISCWQRWMFRK